MDHNNQFPGAGGHGTEHASMGEYASGGHSAMHVPAAVDEDASVEHVTEHSHPAADSGSSQSPPAAQPVVDHDHMAHDHASSQPETHATADTDSGASIHPTSHVDDDGDAGDAQEPEPPHEHEHAAATDAGMSSANLPSCHDCVVAYAGQGIADICSALMGAASGGPAVGLEKRQLCDEALACFHRTNCHANQLSDCYCGGDIDVATCSTTTRAAGLCKTELDRALQVEAGASGATALSRLMNPQYAGGAAGFVAGYETADNACRAACVARDTAQAP